ncbi:hypothetical protein [Brachybacterium tyrofermentans]|uniref:hypothetical protein n=1 Tax=Brachybacterium tyrofermentans TaxID=47848 RepID=UPI003F9205E3
MTTRAGRPQVRAYVWRDGESRTPGAMVKIPATGRNLWIRASDLGHVADQLRVVLAQIEGECER